MFSHSLLRFTAALALALLALPCKTLRGQDASASPAPAGTTAPGVAGFWRCELPGGVYLVALRNIQSISSHDYVVDGAARVTQVTIATSGGVEARFYYLEPLAVPAGPGTASLQALQQRVQDLSASHAPVEPVWEKVVKNYPTTTHSHTVEYRLATKANLQQLYQSLEQAWTTNQGTRLKTE